MAKKSRWEKHQIQCQEENRLANLLIEWCEENGGEVLNSVSCDNPKLAGLDNWECKWSCWKQILEDKKRKED
ncbi:hypothetical protein ACFLU6_10660 [Acidobacteriota bacterium]